MADPYRKTQPGERLAISSRAWNRVLDGTARKNVPVGQGFVMPSLPSVRCVMRKGFATVSGDEETLRPPRIGEAVTLGRNDRFDFFGKDPMSATVPLTGDWEPSAAESTIQDGYVHPYFLMYPIRDGQSAYDPRADDAFAICVNPNSMEFAVSGMAFVRVRVISQWHRFARRNLPRPGDSDEMLDSMVGVLDSCGWGPAQVVGWLPSDFSPREALESWSGEPPYDGTSDQIVWALVKF